MMLRGELFSLLERTGDAAFSVTEQGEICSWNSPAEKLFGYPASEALHKPCHKLLESRDALGALLDADNRECVLPPGAEGEIPNFDLEVKIRSGHRIWVSVSTLIFDETRTGQRLFVHLAHDISARKRNEKLVHEFLNISKRIIEISGGTCRPAPVPPISKQEQQILTLFTQGKNSKEIARELQISLQTLRNHLHRVNQKLGTRNRLEAVMQALQRKLL